MTVSGDTTAPAAKGGLFEDLIDVFVRPAALFERARSQSFVRPALIQTVIFLVLVFALRNLVTPYFDAEFARNMERAAASGQPMPEGAAEMTGKIASFTTTLGMVLAPWFVAILGGLATWIGARIVGARLTYGQSATISSWSYMPAILGYIAMAVQGAITDTSAVRGVGDAQLGPARFVDPATTPPALMSLLTQLDVFNLWSLVIIAIGVSVVAHASRSTGAVAAVIRFAIVAGITLIGAVLSPG